MKTEKILPKTQEWIRKLLAIDTSDINDEELIDAREECEKALNGGKFPPYYCSYGFTMPEDLPDEAYYPLFALHYLYEEYKRCGVVIPSDGSKYLWCFFHRELKIDWKWSKELFIMDSFYPLEEDRVADLDAYIEERNGDLKNAKSQKEAVEIKAHIAHLKEVVLGLRTKISGGKPKAQTPMEQLKMLICLNDGKDFTRAQLAAFDGVSTEDEPDGADSRERSFDDDEISEDVRSELGPQHWTDQYDENPDEYNA